MLSFPAPCENISVCWDHNSFCWIWIIHWCSHDEGVDCDLTFLKIEWWTLGTCIRTHFATKKHYNIFYKYFLWYWPRSIPYSLMLGRKWWCLLTGLQPRSFLCCLICLLTHGHRKNIQCHVWQCFLFFVFYGLQITKSISSIRPQVKLAVSLKIYRWPL